MTHIEAQHTHDGDPPVQPIPFKSPWTDERIKQLLHLHSEEYSAAEIGAIIGITRNAVIGKLTRLGLGKPKPVLTEEQRQERLLARRLNGKRRVRFTSKPKREPIFRISPVNGNSNQMRIAESVTTDMRPVRCVEVETLNISLMDLNKNTCRYPAGEGAAITFCGHLPREGSPYCPEHSVLAFLPPLQRRVAA